MTFEQALQLDCPMCPTEWTEQLKLFPLTTVRLAENGFKFCEIDEQNYLVKDSGNYLSSWSKIKEKDWQVRLRDGTITSDYSQCIPLSISEINRYISELRTLL